MPEQPANNKIHYIHRISAGLQQRIAGIFVLAAVFMLVGLVLLNIQTSRLFDDRIPYHTYLSNAQGVSTETQINISGIDVGQVTSIDITGDNKIHVEFYVFEDFQRLLRTDSSGELSKLSVIGNTSIIIRAGTASLPILPAGSTIAVEEPFTVDELMAEITPIVARLNDIILKVSEMMTLLDSQKIQTAGNDLFILLNNLRTISEQVSSGQGTIGRLLYDRQLEQQMLDPMQKAGPIVDHVDATVKQLQQDMTRVGMILRKTEARIDELASVIEPAGQAAKKSSALMSDLQTTTQQVSRTLEQLPQMIDKVNRLLDSGNQTINATQQVWPLSTIIEPDNQDTQINIQPLDD